MVDKILTLINNCGFPIAMCVIMAYYVKYQNDTVVKAINSLTELVAELKAKIEEVEDD